jgi:hypothetical protein
MSRIPDQYHTILLYSARPRIDPAWLRVRLNTRLAALGLGLVLHEDDADAKGAVRLSGVGLDLILEASAAPLGAETFMGAIGSGADAATRAALVGIVGHHSARVILSCRQAGNPGSPALASRPGTRDRLRLLHLAAATLARTAPPLALYWAPNNRLHHGEGMRAHFEAELPLELFLDFRDRAMGPRRHPGLAAIGAEPWLGCSLNVRIGPGGREAARRAALAFVEAMMAAAIKPDDRGFNHAGQHYRIAHAAEQRHVELIPAAPSHLVEPREAA